MDQPSRRRHHGSGAWFTHISFIRRASEAHFYVLSFRTLFGGALALPYFINYMHSSRSEVCEWQTKERLFRLSVL